MPQQNPLEQLINGGKQFLSGLRLPFGGQPQEERASPGPASSSATAVSRPAKNDLAHAWRQGVSAGKAPRGTTPRQQQQQQQSHNHDAAARSGSSAAEGQEGGGRQAAGLSLSRPVDKEDLGRATWVLLHTLAAQFPDKPTKQQRKDAAALVDLMTRIYPCADCAKHFREVVRGSPVAVGSGPALQQWMCAAHNAVNRRLAKPEFNCRLVGARWRSLDCDEDDTVCSLAPPPGKALE